MCDKIEILKGAERVRRRPAVLFGDDGLEGVMTAFEMLLQTLSAESVKGFSKKLCITRFRDASIGIREYGRGLLLENAHWRALFCQLYAGSAYGDGDFDPDSLHLCAVQYASEYMDVTVRRDGVESCLHFEKGENIGGLTEKTGGEASGVYLRFKPDPAVFTQTVLPERDVEDRARRLALLIPGLQVVFRGETEDGFRETEFCYPAGISDYLKIYSATPVYTAELEARGQERYNRPSYTARVRVGIGFSQAPGFVECYHNQRALTHGGTHVDKLIGEIQKYLDWMLECSVTKEKLAARLQLVVISDAGITQWVNGARTGIANKLIRDMAQDTVGEAFRQYVKENSVALEALFQ